MPDLYAEKMLEMIRQIGQPLVSKGTSTTLYPERSEPLDISSLLMMLMFSDIFKGKKTQAPPLNLLGSATGGVGASQGMTPEMLFSILGSF